MIDEARMRRASDFGLHEAGKKNPEGTHVLLFGILTYFPLLSAKGAVAARLSPAATG